MRNYVETALLFYRGKGSSEQNQNDLQHAMVV